jgi:UDP-GlcNAc:undecaprenyl-phosphate/decaprenyl-phosphate GlcNAc-1-phosphate transferase
VSVVLWELFGGAFAALLVSVITCGALMGSGPLDAPGARKPHKTHTPTSGGAGMALGFAVGLIALAMLSNDWREAITSRGAALLSLTAAFAFAFMLLGFIDDSHPLGPRLKFALFAAVSIAAALAVGVVRTLPFGWGPPLYLPFALGLAGSAAWVFTMVNCVNFMDGANGLAMGAVAIGLAGLAAIAHNQGSPSGVGVALCGAGALVGFLLWNFPGGRLFAGDSGALFAGALAALTSLLIIARIGLSPFVPPILFFPLLADALLTLAWRWRRRRSLLEGHSEHLYQIALRAGWSHEQVALSYWAATAACGVLAFVVSSRYDGAAWLALAGLALIAMIVSAWVRGYALKRGIAEV